MFSGLSSCDDTEQCDSMIEFGTYVGSIDCDDETLFDITSIRFSRVSDGDFDFRLTTSKWTDFESRP